MTGNQPAYLPLELKRQIIDLCTPTTLTSLALVSKLFQAESEVALYRHIFVHLDPQDRVLSMLSNLVSDSVQAGWVRSLTLRYSRSTVSNLRETSHIAEPLYNAFSKLYALKELRLDVASTDRYTADAIQKLLMERHFRLHRLYCRLQGNLPAVIGLPAVTEAHSDSLRILTVTRTGDLDSLVDATVRIARAHPALVIFAYCYLVLSDVLIIFPGALSPEQGFMSYIDNETDCSDVGEVRLYLADTCDSNQLRSLIPEIVQSFPNMNQMTFVVRGPLEASFVEKISLITSSTSTVTPLRPLEFRVWSGTLLGAT